MSSKGVPSSKERGESNALPADRNAYQTPLPLAKALLHRLRCSGLWIPTTSDDATPCRILEPSAGEGNFVKAIWSCIAGERAEVTAIDPSNREVDVGVPEGTRLEWHRTTFEQYAAMYSRNRFDLIVGNPPFSLAEAHIELALSMLAPHGVLCFLLRLGHQLEAEERALVQWRAHKPRRVDSCSPRPSFGGKSNDSVPYGFFAWQRGYKGPTELDILFWREGLSRSERMRRNREELAS